MPRVVGQRDSNLQMRGMIVALHEQGLNYSEISRRVGISVSKNYLTN